MNKFVNSLMQKKKDELCIHLLLEIKNYEQIPRKCF